MAMKEDFVPTIRNLLEWEESLCQEVGLGMRMGHMWISNNDGVVKGKVVWKGIKAAARQIKQVDGDTLYV